MRDKDRNMRTWCTSLLVAALAAWAPLTASAQELPQMLPYNGFLADTNGQPVDGTINLTVRIYETSDAANPIWQEALADVPVDAGYFRVDLGRVVPLAADVAAGRTRYLGISVNGDAEATPRQAIGAVPYALMAADSAALGGQPAGAYVSVDRLNQELAGRGFITREEVVQLVDGGQAGIDEDAVNALIDARGYLSQAAIDALIDGRGYLDQAAIDALIDGRGYLSEAAVTALIDGRGYLSEAAITALIDGRGYLSEAAIEALIDGRGYLTAAALDARGYQDAAAVDARIDGRGYLNQAAIEALIGGAGYLDEAAVNALIAGAGYLDADAINALIDGRGYITNAAAQALVIAAGAQASAQLAQVQAQVNGLNDTVANLTATVAALQASVAALQANTGGAYLLGRSQQTSNGRFSFGGVAGVQAATAMCQAAYPNDPTAHFCSVTEVQQAVTASAYDANSVAAMDNVATWTTAPVARGGSFNGSDANTCLSLRYNSADAARGTRLTLDFNHQSAGNGGGVVGTMVNVQSDVACGTNMPVLCCR